MNRRFSDRFFNVPKEVPLQRESMNDEIRSSLWNVLQIYFVNNLEKVPADSSFSLDAFFQVYYISFKKMPLYEQKRNAQELSDLAKIFRIGEWYEVYDHLEFIFQWYLEAIGERSVSYNAGYAVFRVQFKASEFKTSLNFMLEREGAVFRIVGDELAEITSAHEVEEIENALNNAQLSEGAQDHLERALSHLSDRVNPDFRNSIKESISAVESLCKSKTDDPKGTLGALLKYMEVHGTIHPAMKDAYSKLYGFTSDSGGIRHAMTDMEVVSYKDARFMLIVCSAFINFVTELTD